MRHLLQAPGFEARLELERAQTAIRQAFPLKTAHRKALPFSVQELSRLLTSERGQIQGYWQKPSLTGAYLYYFLPWNLLRLAWLLPNLPLDLPESPKIIDLGSGPLTLPLGLWMFRPELRGREVSLTCADTAQRPMELGRAVLENLQAAAEAPEQPGPPPSGKKTGQSKLPVDPPKDALRTRSPWNIRLLRAPLDVALRKAGKVNLILAGNVLNEIQARQDSLEERLEEIFLSMDKILEPGGQILLIEPGTRLGGKLVSLLRRVALAQGYQVEAPCTHEADCPYAPPELDDTLPARGAPRQPSGWCHFNLYADGAPEELINLSRAAHLEKERLSFSLIFLRKAGAAQPAALGQGKDKTVPGGLLTRTRVVSDPIRLPDGDNARYVCSRHGLGLLRGADGFKSGMLAEALLPDKAGRDIKSGAWLMLPARQASQSGKSQGKPERVRSAKAAPGRRPRAEDEIDATPGLLGNSRSKPSSKPTSKSGATSRPERARKQADRAESSQPQKARASRGEARDGARGAKGGAHKDQGSGKNSGQPEKRREREKGRPRSGSHKAAKK